MPIRPIKPRTKLGMDAALPPARSRSRPVGKAPDSLPVQETAKPENPAQEAVYAVGYGKPPVANQFKPGQSGNPKGRPKAAKGLKTIVRDTLTQKVIVRTASGEKRISRIEAALHKTIELAMKGNPAALAHLLKLYADAVPDAKSEVDEQKSAEDLTATDLAMLEELRLMLIAGEGAR